jgi:hypothetical protein
MEVDVEILDVTDDEARTLLLSIDPLAALAEAQAQLHQRLLELTPTDSAALEAAWQAAAEACLKAGVLCQNFGQITQLTSAGHLVECPCGGEDRAQ